MVIVKVDNGELIIGIPVGPDDTISTNTFNRLFPNATAFLFKRNNSNVWTEIERDDNGNYLPPDGVWNANHAYKAYDTRVPRRRSSRSSSSISWNNFRSIVGSFLWSSSSGYIPKKNQ